MMCTQLAECMGSIDNGISSSETSSGKAKTKRKKESKESLSIVEEFCNQDRRKSCIAHNDNRIIMVCEEHRRKYTLKKEIADIQSICFHVDGGMVDKEEPVRRCDYAFFLKDEEKRLILIELKGISTGDAISQLAAMMEWKEIKRAIASKAIGKIYGRIVSTVGVPKIYQSRRLELAKLFAKYGGNLKIFTSYGEETYQQLCTER